MKTEKYNCTCCGEQTRKARSIAIVNVENFCLCNTCNLILINEKVLRITDKIVLKVIGVIGDFITIKAFADAPKENFWENRRKSYENAEKDNVSTVGWDTHESY
ncbi:MAG: hypothetical protein ACI9AT_002047 [Ulvibacter sp.]|jgi:hypothetical protein